MQTRRGFLRLLGGLAAAVGLAQIPALAPAARPPSRFARRGVPGETYFLAPSHGGRPYPLPPDTALYLNGEDVTLWTYEADLVGGWVRGYQHHVDASGKLCLDNNGWNIISPGKVELRPKLVAEARK